jgi:hypothetical protein
MKQLGLRIGMINQTVSFLSEKGIITDFSFLLASKLNNYTKGTLLRCLSLKNPIILGFVSNLQNFPSF